MIHSIRLDNKQRSNQYNSARDLFWKWGLEYNNYILYREIRPPQKVEDFLGVNILKFSIMMWQKVHFVSEDLNSEFSFF